jgi:protoporphyrin/coproporphyrin ferrochelatase
MKQIVLTHMGGPSDEAELALFLKNIFLDRQMMRLPMQSVSGTLLAGLRFKRSKAHYERTGWTPVEKLTSSLADKLNVRLNRDGFNVRAMYTHLPPYIEEAPADALIVPLYPQYSSALTGAMEKRLPGRKVVRSWHDRKDFTGMLAGGIKESISCLDPARTALMFIAHGLPESFAKNNDPYIGQIGETYRALAAHFPGRQTSLSYIGKAGPGKWAGPGAEEVVFSLKSIETVIAAYISFPLDNIETLYDIDIGLKEAAEKHGIKNFARAALPNDSDGFAAILENIIRGDA